MFRNQGELDALYLDARLEVGRTRKSFLRRHPVRRLRLNARLLLGAAAIFGLLMRGVPDAALRREYQWRICRVGWRRREPEIIQCYAIRCAMHYHAHKMVQEMGYRADHFTPSGVTGSCVRRCEVISASVSADVKVSSPRRLAPLQAFSSQSGGGAAVRMKSCTLMITTAGSPRRSTMKRSLFLVARSMICPN